MKHTSIGYNNCVIGTGLGLSLTFDIIKAHGAELSARSEEGQGATIIIQFPF